MLAITSATELVRDGEVLGKPFDSFANHQLNPSDVQRALEAAWDKLRKGNDAAIEAATSVLNTKHKEGLEALHKTYAEAMEKLAGERTLAGEAHGKWVADSAAKLEKLLAAHNKALIEKEQVFAAEIAELQAKLAEQARLIDVLGGTALGQKMKLGARRKAAEAELVAVDEESKSLGL